MISFDHEIRPRTGHRSYSNPDSQGSLITQTANWDDTRLIPSTEGNSAYIDRMQSWDRGRFHQMVAMMGGTAVQQMGVDRVVENASDETLIEAAQFYFRKPIVAVRWIYYFNVATGYPCERIDYLVKEES